MSVETATTRSDKKNSESLPEQEAIADALQSETDEPLPPRAEAIAERDAASPHPVTPQGKRRRYLTRRNAFIAAIAAYRCSRTHLLLLLIYTPRLCRQLRGRSDQGHVCKVWHSTEIKAFTQLPA